MELELGALIGGLATATAAGLGLVLTARQIRLSREAEEQINRWRGVEFVRSVINQLDGDDEVQFCLRALDWGVGPLVVPVKHRALFRDQRQVMEHDTEKMERALHVRLSPEWEKYPEILVYRLAFDHFFTAIESVVTYGRRLEDDFLRDIGMSYCKDLIRHPPYMKSDDGESPISDFVRNFYKDLLGLIWDELN